MEISTLKYFVRVCETKSFTKAAKELFVTQQALSKIINNLENEIGASLFLRNSRGVNLTELGKFVLPKAEMLIEQFNEFNHEVLHRVDTRNVKLKIGFAPGTLQIIGVKELVEFGRAFLDLEIDIGEFSDVDCESNVISGQLDLALTVNPVNENRLSYIHLMKENLIAIVNTQNPLSVKTSVTFKDLINEKLILLDDTYRIQQVFMEHFKKAGFSPDVYFRSSRDLSIAYDLVDLNKGIFVFVEKLTHVEKYQNVCCIPIDVPSAYWDAGFIVKKGVKINYAVTEFINYFLDKQGLKLISFMI